MKAVVLIIDMINDFVTGVFGSKRAQDIVQNIRHLIEISHEKNVPVIYLQDAHSEGDPELAVFGEHAMRGTKGAETIEELASEDDDFIIKKHQFSGFFQTELDTILEKLDADTLILAGVATHICVCHTAADAFFRGYRTVIVRDCVNASTEEEHRQGLAYMERIYGAEIVGLSKVEELF
uniref:Putative isochorismatase family protein n=1 Tax=Candidatus Methanogaster sp. ANME-2c ERB4 TaxID=2759911 RepID=A0A7G9YIR4_9EURY|nr:putative isochorismatase family protein [Methanosarcinales archaeon ANME-2c ERB4]